MNRPPLSPERGQSLVIVALVLIALIGMLALAFDGGNAFFQRRIAQNAADAGALAGARELCVTGIPSLAIDRALEYAIDRNGALAADASIEYNLVTVNSFITFPTTFGNALGRSEMTAPATAIAGCFTPTSATGALPVAWSCRPPVVGQVVTNTCVMQYGEDHLYYIMDSKTVGDHVTCQDPPQSGIPPTGFDCDYDDDGYDDLLGSGNRSWLDLNGGGGGASELRDWVLGDVAATVNIHNWLQSQAGNDNAVYFAVHDRMLTDPDVIIPVFDKFCTGRPSTVCPALYDAGDQTIIGGGASALYYHIISFSIFHITCVNSGPYKCSPPPGIAASKARDYKWIEGYFEVGFPSGLGGGPGGGGAAAGAYTLYLVQ